MELTHNKTCWKNNCSRLGATDDSLVPGAADSAGPNKEGEGSQGGLGSSWQGGGQIEKQKLPRKLQ